MEFYSNRIYERTVGEPLREEARRGMEEGILVAPATAPVMRGAAESESSDGPDLDMTSR